MFKIKSCSRKTLEEMKNLQKIKNFLLPPFLNDRPLNALQDNDKNEKEVNGIRIGYF